MSMTFLELVQRLHSEAGATGTAPATVIGQTGMDARLVNWTKTAYEDVQEEHDTWLFRRDEFDFPTVSGQGEYTPAGVGLIDFSEWVFDPDVESLSGITLYSSEADEQHLVYLPWDDFKRAYDYGSHRSQTDRPTIFTVKPDQTMKLWAIPNAIFTVRGEYVKQPVSFTANDDVPVFNDFHMIIVWKALMYYGEFKGAPEVYAFGQDEYKKMLAKLEIKQLPKLRWGASLV